VARRRQARSYELRIATGYGRWLCRHGRDDEVPAVLAPAYASFTEGLNTRDLCEARELLETVSAHGAPPDALPTARTA
jgi:predicted ATPase